MKKIIKTYKERMEPSAPAHDCIPALLEENAELRAYSAELESENAAHFARCDEMREALHECKTKLAAELESRPAAPVVAEGLNPDAVTAAVAAWRDTTNHPSDDSVDRWDIGKAIKAYLLAAHPAAPAVVAEGLDVEAIRRVVTDLERDSDGWDGELAHDVHGHVAKLKALLAARDPVEYPISRAQADLILKHCKEPK